MSNVFFLILVCDKKKKINPAAVINQSSKYCINLLRQTDCHHHAYSILTILLIIGLACNFISVYHILCLGLQ